MNPSKSLPQSVSSFKLDLASRCCIFLENSAVSLACLVDQSPSRESGQPNFIRSACSAVRLGFRNKAQIPWSFSSKYKDSQQLTANGLYTYTNLTR